MYIKFWLVQQFHIDHSLSPNAYFVHIFPFIQCEATQFAPGLCPFKNMARKRNSIVYLDVSIGDELDGRMIFEVCFLLPFL